MLNLTIQHFIYLTREQRYDLHEGAELIVHGVSVPVWFLNTNTSEPAREIFCRYYLKNTKEDHPIQILPDGYGIQIPYREGGMLLNEQGQPISNDEWRELNFHNPEKLDELYKKQIMEVSAENLLDPPHGGKHLFYREHNKVQQDGSQLNIVHYVNMNDIEKLCESLV